MWLLVGHYLSAPRYREFFSAGVIAVLRTTVAQFPHSPLVALRCVEFLETVARLGKHCSSPFRLMRVETLCYAAGGAQVRLVQEKGPDLAALAMDQHTGYPPLFRTAATVLAVTAASGNYNREFRLPAHHSIPSEPIHDLVLCSCCD